MKLGVFGDERLLKNDALFGVETRGQVVGNDFDRILCDLRSVGVVAGERVPVSDEVEAVVFGIVLEANPVLQRPKVVADVESPGGAHAADYALQFSASPRQPSLRPFVSNKM